MGRPLVKAIDAEDLAMAALFSLYRAVRKEREQPLELANRSDLLRLLARFTMQKVREVHRHHTQAKRDVRRTVRDGDLPDGLAGQPFTMHVLDRQMPPEWRVQFEDTKAAWLSDLLPKQREIVDLRLEGLPDAEIAARLGCSKRTVERNLNAIRARWQERAAAFESNSEQA